MGLREIAIALCCAGTVSLQEPSARADSDDLTEDFGPKRELSQHVFYPSLIINNPFVSTYFALATAAGYSWIEGPAFDRLGNLLGNRGDVSYRAAAMAQAAAFQATVTDSLALRIVAGGGLNGGVNGRSALVVGMVQPLSVGAGATYACNVAHNVRLGGTVDFVYAHTKLIQPLEGIRSSLLAGEVAPGLVSDKVNSYTVLPGATVAYAPSAALGLLASAQYGWTHVSDDVSRNFNAFAVGASAQLDLLPDHMWPIGFLVSYRATIPFNSDVRFTNDVEGGLFYTGRRDLDLGLDFQGKWFDLRPEHRPRLDTTQLIGIVELRYHWN